MANSRVGRLIEDWMDSFGKERGYELSRTEFVKEGPDRFLRVYVDKLTDGEYGVMSTDDCELISRYLSDLLDKEDPIKENYYLEVSSPGMDRLLTGPKDYARFTGSLVDVKLYKPLEGKKQHSGTLKAFDDTNIILSCGDKDLTVPLEQISKINLTVVF